MSQVTKRALEQALKHFLSQKPLNKVTISDLTEYCGISRMTFYYHFDDIYDLVTWCCEENLKRALDMENIRDTWQEGLFNIFQIVLDDRAFVLNVYRVMGPEQTRRYLAPFIHQVISRVIGEEADGLPISEADKHFIIDCYQYIFCGVMLDWVQAGMSEDPANIVKRLDTLLHGSIALTLSNFSGPSLSS